LRANGYPGADGLERGDLDIGELARGRRPDLPALTPGSAISEGAARGRLRMFVFESRVSDRTRTVTDDLCGCTGRAAISPDPRFEVRELGEIDMASMALATLDLVTHDDAQPAFPG